MCFQYFGDRLIEYVVYSTFVEQGKTCFICEKGGHRADVCSEISHGGSKSSKICLKCGNSSHDMSSCKNDYAADDLRMHVQHIVGTLAVLGHLIPIIDVMKKVILHANALILAKAWKKKGKNEDGYKSGYKVKQNGGWISDDPEDYPQPINWRSPSTPRNKRAKISNFSTGGNSSVPRSSRMSNRLDFDNSFSYGSDNYNHHRFSAYIIITMVFQHLVILIIQLLMVQTIIIIIMDFQHHDLTTLVTIGGEIMVGRRNCFSCVVIRLRDSWEAEAVVIFSNSIISIRKFPLIIRLAFTLGGTGGGIAYNREEFEAICEEELVVYHNSKAHSIIMFGRFHQFVPKLSFKQGKLREILKLKLMFSVSSPLLENCSRVSPPRPPQFLPISLGVYSQYKGVTEEPSSDEYDEDFYVDNTPPHC
ncbi:hypothetical protein BC332_07988 [Capsicum chinense]|nr:hypothetical protein BC332_07988 [Capsicum chinense]